MQSEMRKSLNLILKQFSELDYVHPEDIPNIDLYVDQVTTFIESQLSSLKRDEDEKILTKTMINNYTKNHVLPSPDKKKYSKDHVLTLILIYYLKSFLSIKDIQTNTLARSQNCLFMNCTKNWWRRAMDSPRH